MVLPPAAFYGAVPPILDRFDGAIAPGGSLPGSAVLAGGVVPTTRFLDRPGGRIAYDDSGGAGPLVSCAPSLGDLRQEYRFLTPQLVATGFHTSPQSVARSP